MASESLLDKATTRAMELYKEAGDIRKIPHACRTLLYVSQAQAIMDNGGLQYFFEKDWIDHPDYAVFVDTYREVGAAKEADALARAVAMFPFKNPQNHEKLRNEFLDSFKDDEGEVIPGQSPFEPIDDFLCGNKNVWQCLEKYAEDHARAFESARSA